MSLIPSESYSFPDHFTKTVAGSRKAENIEPEPEPEPEVIEPVCERPALVALPTPKPRVIAKPQPVLRPQPVAKLEPVARPEPVLEPEPLVMPEAGIGLEPMAELEPLTKPELFAEPEPMVEPAPLTRPELFAEPEVVVAKETPKLPLKITPRIPNPALRRANAPPPRIPEAPVRKIVLPTLKPKVRWNNRAPAMDPAAAAKNGNNGNGNGANHFVPEPEPLLPPAQNVIQMKPAPPVPRPLRETPRAERIPPPPITKSIPVAPPPRPSSPPPAMPKPAAFTPPQKPVQPIRPAPPPPPVPKRENARPVAPAQPKPPMRVAPRPVVVAPDPQTDFFQDFAESGETAISKRRRKAKMRRFLICESIAVGVLLPLVILGLAHRPENAALGWMMNILTIASAVAASLIPILFFALNPTLPEIER